MDQYYRLRVYCPFDPTRHIGEPPEIIALRKNLCEKMSSTKNLMQVLKQTINSHNDSGKSLVRQVQVSFQNANAHRIHPKQNIQNLNQGVEKTKKKRRRRRIMRGTRQSKLLKDALIKQTAEQLRQNITQQQKKAENENQEKMQNKQVTN